jgi:hypothetical protein
MQRPSSPILRRLTVGVLACAALAASLGVVATANAPAKTPQAVVASVPACKASGLDVWLDTNGSGAAGSSYYNLEFTNLSGHACTITAYPGVSAVNLSGHQIGAAAARNAGHEAVVTLAADKPNNGAGATASVLLQITDTGVYSPSACRPVVAAGLRVYPPNETASKVVPYPFTTCSRSSNPTVLHIQPIAKGTGEA